MTDDINSAFVEIAAGAPDLNDAVERLLPLYQDVTDGAAAEPPRPRPRVARGCVWALLIAVLVAFTFAAVGTTSSAPRPTDSPIPANVNPAY